MANTFEREEGLSLMSIESLVLMAENSIGSGTWRQLLFEKVVVIDGVEQIIAVDPIGDGDLACALFMSSLLVLFRFNLAAHTTVVETEKDIRSCGGVKCDKPARGRIVIWGEKFSDTDKKMHLHIGICTSETHAVSTRPETKSPQLHRIDSLRDHKGNQRPVLCYYQLRES